MCKHNLKFRIYSLLIDMITFCIDYDIDTVKKQIASCMNVSGIFAPSRTKAFFSVPKADVFF